MHLFRHRIAILEYGKMLPHFPSRKNTPRGKMLPHFPSRKNTPRGGAATRLAALLYEGLHSKPLWLRPYPKGRGARGQGGVGRDLLYPTDIINLVPSPPYEINYIGAPSPPYEINYIHRGFSAPRAALRLSRNPHSGVGRDLLYP